MPLLDDVAQRARSAATSVRKLFAPTPERDHHNSPDNVETSASSHDLAKASSEPQTTHLPTSGQRTRIVSKFMTDIDAEEAEQRAREAQDKSQIDRAFIVRTPTQSNTVPSNSGQRNGTLERRRYVPSADERRALGLAEKTPKDAVRIEIPSLSTHPVEERSPEMPSLSFKKVNAGFKPTNTLDGPGIIRSSKAEYMHNQIRRSNGVKLSSGPSNIQNSHNIDSPVPRKKQRIGVSPLNTKRSLQGTNNTNLQREASPDDLMHPTYAEEIREDDHEQQHTRARVISPKPDMHVIQQVLRGYSPSDIHEGSTLKPTTRTRRLDRGSPKHVRLTEENRRSLSQKNSMIASSPDQPKISGYFQTGDDVSPGPNGTQILNIPESPDELQSGPTILEFQRYGPGRRTSVEDSTPAPIAHRTTFSNTESSKSHRGKRHLKGSMADNTEISYKLKSAVIFNHKQGSSYRLNVFPAQKLFSINIDGSLLADDTDPVATIRFLKVRKVEFYPGNTKAIFQILTGVLPGDRFAVDFASEKDHTQFMHTLQTIGNVDASTKGFDYMEKAYIRTADHIKNVLEHKQTMSCSIDTSPSSPDPQKPGKLSRPRQPRLVDRLDHPRFDNQEVVAGSPSTQHATASDTRKISYQHQDVLQERNTKHLSTTSSVKSLSMRRTTRSQASHDTEDSRAMEPDQLPRPDVYETLSKWERPLVYPAQGKKRETVPYEDLKRLNDDEFLNDNLVGLFLRYLQEHGNKDSMKRMHFFNSFFFDVLTKDVKGKKAINYEAVVSWTKHINIFNRDFVIVPVNENFHWFIMIICNFSALKPGADLHPGLVELPDEIEPAGENGKQSELQEDDPEIKQILISDVMPNRVELEGRRSLEDLTLGEDTTIKSPKRGKSNLRKRIRKYSLNKPVIITLDSLNQNRSNIATSLRCYVRALAEDSRQPHQPFSLQEVEIKNMTAKGIPTQHNFSDCGLYLCMYLEQFVSDPDTFVRCILQGEQSQQGWPTNIKSSELRQRLANMLDELYKEQQSRSGYQAQVPPIGSILINMEVPKPVKVAKSTNIGDVHAAKERYDRLKAAHGHDSDIHVKLSPKHIVLDQPHDAHVDSNHKSFLTELHEYANTANQASDNAILIEDDPEPVIRRDTGTISTHFATKTSPRQTNKAKPNTLLSDLDTPQALADRMKRERSPKKHISPAEKPRSVSVSTDYLHSDEQWNQHFRQFDDPPSQANDIHPKFAGTHQRFAETDDEEDSDIVEIPGTEDESDERKPVGDGADPDIIMVDVDAGAIHGNDTEMLIK